MTPVEFASELRRFAAMLGNIRPGDAELWCIESDDLRRQMLARAAQIAPEHTPHHFNSPVSRSRPGVVYDRYKREVRVEVRHRPNGSQLLRRIDVA